VDDSRSQDDGSSGLGLSIAKWIVEAHCATIHVASTTGRGSTFTVLMPMCPHAPEMESLRHKAVLD
jgi:signal transduction histidine kinase